MDLTTTHEFGAPIAKTWDLLLDTNAIAQCLPGCRSLKPLGDDRHEVELGMAIAAMAGEFKGTVEIRDKVPPTSYTLLIDGTGRQGFVKGEARVTLEAMGDRTRVHIAGHADAGGMIARVGQRLLEGVARTVMERFFACMAARLS